MGVGATNRIIDRKLERIKVIKSAVSAYETRKKHRRKFNFIKDTVDCTQCNRKMCGKIGRLQVENNRENAPICVPCIVGIPRVPLKISKKRNAYSKETKKKWKKFLKNAGKQKVLNVINIKDSPFKGESLDPNDFGEKQWKDTK